MWVYRTSSLQRRLLATNGGQKCNESTKEVKEEGEQNHDYINNGGMIAFTLTNCCC
jgi:hypothetical protein